MVKIKICGLRREVDVDYVNALKPDYIGFILTDGFRRSVDIESAKKLKSKLSPDIKAVGVFVDDDIDKINFCLDNGIIDLAQLHGNESPEYCDKIHGDVIKVFKPDSFERIDEYNTAYVLLDSGTGTGKSFDWSLIPSVDKPMLLAGGINAENLQEAISKVHPFGIDLSSAVEVDGYKDYDKIKEIMEIVK